MPKKLIRNRFKFEEVNLIEKMTKPFLTNLMYAGHSLSIANASILIIVKTSNIFATILYFVLCLVFCYYEGWIETAKMISSKFRRISLCFGIQFLGIIFEFIGISTIICSVLRDVCVWICCVIFYCEHRYFMYNLTSFI